MFPPLILLAAGGLFGFAHERFRRKRLAEHISSQLNPDVLDSDTIEPDVQDMASGDLVQIKTPLIASSYVHNLWRYKQVFPTQELP